MKADWSDAPSYIKANTKRAGASAFIVPWIIGTCVTAGLLHIAGSAFLTGTVQNLAERPTPAKPVPMTNITSSVPSTNWDRVVEEQAARDAQLQPALASPSQTIQSPQKQTVFNDSNYTPRGADNVLSLKVAAKPEPAPQQKKEKGGRLTIIEQSPSMKDMVCGTHKEGSIEQRNCRSHIGLNYRD